MKTLTELNAFFAPDLQEEVAQSSLAENRQAVLNLTIDSRQVQEGDCFIALQGEQAHGLDFLVAVLAKHPSLVLSDKKLNADQRSLFAQSVVTKCLVVENIESTLGAFADWFYDQPSQRLKVVGITGTNGKTSTAFYTAQLLEELGEKTALIGTLGNGVLNQGKIQSLSETRNTTPDAISVHRLLATFSKQGVAWVMMEVSSHALELGRVSGVTFDTVALTQVTRDHIDFHGSLGAYQCAKKRLFTEYPARVKVLNAKDAVGQSLIAQLDSDTKEAVRLWCYAVINEKPAQTSSSLYDLYAHSLRMTTDGMQFTLSGKALREGGEEKNKRIFMPLLGVFNVENMLCALSIVLASSFKSNKPTDWTKLTEVLSSLQAVPGRMQRIKLPDSQPTVLIDFAHTPDALEQVLKAIKQHVSESKSGRFWVVFGCGGDRDQGKRPLMAKVVEHFADETVVTSDNPRQESPEQIVTQIMEGFQQPGRVHVVLDRAQAIEKALSNATSEDVVLIAGKGHENTQEINGTKIPFQDEKVVLKWVKKQMRSKP